MHVWKSWFIYSINKYKFSNIFYFFLLRDEYIEIKMKISVIIYNNQTKKKKKTECAGTFDIHLRKKKNNQKLIEPFDVINHSTIITTHFFFLLVSLCVFNMKYLWSVHPHGMTSMLTDCDCIIQFIPFAWTHRWNDIAI